MATIYERLGSNIKRLRKQKHLSQEQLAFAAKLDLTSVSEIESGLRNPSLKSITKIAKALGTKPSELIR